MLCYGGPATMCGRNPTSVHKYPKLDGWEEGGHGQGVSYTDEKHTMKNYSPVVPDAAFTVFSAAAALSWWLSHGRGEEESCWQGVSATDEIMQ